MITFADELAFEKLRKNFALSTCAFDRNRKQEKNRNRYVVRFFKILPGPAVPVEAAVLDGLGDVVCFYVLRTIKIGNGSCYF